MRKLEETEYVKSNQRKSTIRSPPLHPHCVRAYDAIGKGQIDLAYADVGIDSDNESDHGDLSV